MKNKAAQELGSLGGNKTFKTHGKEHFSKMGKIARENDKKLKEIRKEIKSDKVEGIDLSSD